MPRGAGLLGYCHRVATGIVYTARVAGASPSGQAARLMNDGQHLGLTSTLAWLLSCLPGGHQGPERAAPRMFPVAPTVPKMAVSSQRAMGNGDISMRHQSRWLWRVITSGTQGERLRLHRGGGAPPGRLRQGIYATGGVVYILGRSAAPSGMPCPEHACAGSSSPRSAAAHQAHSTVTRFPVASWPLGEKLHLFSILQDHPSGLRRMVVGPPPSQRRHGLAPRSRHPHYNLASTFAFVAVNRPEERSTVPTSFVTVHFWPHPQRRALGTQGLDLKLVGGGARDQGGFLRGRRAR